MYFVLALRHYKKIFKYHIITTIQISLGCLIALMLIGERCQTANLLNIATAWEHENVVFYMPDELIEYEDGRRTLAIEEIKKQYPVEKIYYTVGTDEKGNEFLLICYEENTADVFENPMKSGKWFTETKQEDSINCVFLGNYSVLGTNKLSVEYCTINSDVTRKKDFKITGYLGKTNYLLDFAVSSNELALENILTQYTASDFSGGVLLFSSSDVQKEITEISNSSLVFLDNETNSEDIVKMLKNEAWAISLKNIIANTNKMSIYSSSSYIPLVICLISMGLVSGFCLTYLSHSRDKYNYEIYRLCGITQRKKLSIFFYNNILLSLQIFVLTLVLYQFTKYNGIINYYSLNVIAVLIVMFVFVLVLAGVLTIIQFLIENVENGREKKS